MDFSSITADQARSELETLIRENPDRMGYVVHEDYDQDPACVYYTDQNGMPINSSSYDPMYDDEPVLTTPVCIVGQWVESFHPELKDDLQFGAVLLRNTTMRSLYAGETPLNRDVLDLLSNAQDQQDREIPWGLIDFNKDYR